MSQKVKTRKAAQRNEITLNKVVNAVNKVQQAKAKNNSQEKLRQQLMQRQLTVGFGSIYG